MLQYIYLNFKLLIWEYGSNKKKVDIISEGKKQKIFNVNVINILYFDNKDYYHKITFLV